MKHNMIFIIPKKITFILLYQFNAIIKKYPIFYTIHNKKNFAENITLIFIF